ncbi:MAG: hypothetical protein HYZ35_03635 [Chloroflexi bacterium]|nr:hypothetical protein [Chloroflexota bacterium]
MVVTNRISVGQVCYAVIFCTQWKIKSMKTNLTTPLSSALKERTRTWIARNEDALPPEKITAGKKPESVTLSNRICRSGQVLRRKAAAKLCERRKNAAPPLVFAMRGLCGPGTVSACLN